jgi:hypothetical protein
MEESSKEIFKEGEREGRFGNRSGPQHEEHPLPATGRRQALAKCWMARQPAEPASDVLDGNRDNAHRRSGPDGSNR